MSQKDSALYSPYIIDGVLQELTPARILSAVTEDSSECAPDSSLPAVVDETVDAPVRTVDYDSLKDNTVTLCFRDTMEQERVSIDELRNIIEDKVSIHSLLKKLQ